MKSVMAEAENSKSSNPQVPTAPYRTTTPDKTSQRDWQSQMPAKAAERSSNTPTGSLRPTGSPWKLPSAPAISPMALPALLPPPSPSNGAMPLGTPPRTLSHSTVLDCRPPTTPPVPARITPSQSSQLGLGPVFAPSRQPSTKSGPSSIRRVPYVDHQVLWFTLILTCTIL